jgi:hypothetical protein
MYVVYVILDCTNNSATIYTISRITHLLYLGNKDNVPTKADLEDGVAKFCLLTGLLQYVRT